MVKHIIFDFDGTIVDSLDITIKVGNELANKYGFPEFKKEELKILMTLPIEERIKKMGIPFYKLPKFLVDFKSRYQHYVRNLQAIEGMVDVLYQLEAQGSDMGIISSNAVSNIEEFLKANNINIFKNIYSSKGIFGKHQTIKSYLKKYKISQSEAIYVGDELRDIEACKKTGVSIISVVWGFDPLELLKNGNPEHIANKPEDILEIFGSLA